MTENKIVKALQDAPEDMSLSEAVALILKLWGREQDNGNIGAQGPQGEKGDKGDTGATGPQGEQGVQGEKGDKGDRGPIGPQGPAGGGTGGNPMTNDSGEYLFSYFKIAPDGTTLSDADALQRMFDECPVGNFDITLHLQHKTLTLNKAVYYRYNVGARIVTVKCGRIKSNTKTHDLIVPDPAMKELSILWGAEENNSARWTMEMHFDRVSFKNGRNQLVLFNQRLSTVTGCRFDNGKRGLLNIFGQQCVVSRCLFQFHDVESLVHRSGLGDKDLMEEYGVIDNDIHDEKWLTNATGQNSCSNRAETKNCWFFGKNGQIGMYRVQASDGTENRNCVFEGGSTVHSIYLDSRNSTTTHSARVLQPHIEHGNSNITRSLIFTKNIKSTYIEDFFSQIAYITAVEAEGALGHVIMDKLHFMHFTPNCFKTDPRKKWSFINPTTMAIPRTSSIWGGWDGTPDNLYVQVSSNIEGNGKSGLGLRSRYRDANGEQQGSVVIKRYAMFIDGIRSLVHGVTFITERNRSVLSRLKRFFSNSEPEEKIIEAPAETVEMPIQERAGKIEKKPLPVGMTDEYSIEELKDLLKEDAERYILE